MQLADIKAVGDLPTAGGNGAGAATALHSRGGRFTPFVLAPSSDFVYKWQAGLQPPDRPRGNSNGLDAACYPSSATADPLRRLPTPEGVQDAGAEPLTVTLW